jgi:hypothetical protein
MIQMIRDVIYHICASGLWTDGDIRDCFCYANRKPIKPKDEKMDENEPKVEIITKAGRVVLLLDDAIKIGEEAKSKKTEIAKREEIGPGDYVVWLGTTIFRVASLERNFIKDRRGDYFSVNPCKKLHPTPEVRAWLDKTIGGEW